ncbi:TerD family protein [Streptomyces sp. NK15101]|uniref:TerD family protein n=1 Tax=Streptomyces sp. NK15101 TaxID=2873261 RepID=UPI0021F23AB7|nr:TerD family protein [Streptomyces sp. NK15101]
MMRGLIKGDNAFVPTAALRVAVRSGGIDVAALLVTETGRVRGDADIVFPGAPVHASGAVRLAEDEDGTVWLDADLTGVEEAVARVLLVASTEEGALRDARGLSVEVLGPDGTTVVAYEVTDAGDETAMVLAELYRRSGGWKFRAVGQGYVDGLTGLAADHGVDVSEEPREAPRPAQAQDPAAIQAPVATPAPAPASVPVQAPAPPAAQGLAPAPAPAPVPDPPAPAQPSAPPAPLRPTREQLLDMTPDQIRALAAEHARARAEAAPATPPEAAPRPDASAWSCGPVFKPRTVTGRDSDVITEKDLPPGPVMVEVTLKGEGYQGLWPLDDSNAKGSSLVSTTEKGFRGRVLTSVPAHGRLRLRLQASGSWELRVLPLSEARRLSERRLETWGPDILLHTGGTADVAFHYRGDSNFIVRFHKLAGHTDTTTLPNSGGSVISEIGERRDTVPMPEGPVLVVVVHGEGAWSARLKDVQPHSGGGSFGAPGQPSEPRRALSWLRRSRG